MGYAANTDNGLILYQRDTDKCGNPITQGNQYFVATEQPLDISSLDFLYLPSAATSSSLCFFFLNKSATNGESGETQLRI